VVVRIDRIVTVSGKLSHDLVAERTVGCIRNDGAATRADLADRLGLSIGTIRRRVRSMLEAGQLIEVGRAPLGGKLLGLPPGS